MTDDAHERWHARERTTPPSGACRSASPPSPPSPASTPSPTTGPMMGREQPRLSGRVSVHARRAAVHVPWAALDDAQYAGYSTPEDSNARYRFLLSQGQTGLSVAFDLPTQTGYDADHDMARAEIGKVGVPISSLADMEALFDGIPLAEVTTSMTINATAPMLLAALPRRRAQAGRAVRRDRWHDAERRT